MTLRGIIIPAGWDGSYNVTDIALAANDEVDYFIEKDSLGQKLFRFIRQNVALTGKISQKGRIKTIKVVGFEILDYQPPTGLGP